MELHNKDVLEVTRRKLGTEVFEGAVPEPAFLAHVLKAAGTVKV